MSNHRKTWSTEDKLQIIHHAKEYGISKTSREFSVSTTSISNWENKFSELGPAGLERNAKSSQQSELHKLRRENRELKNMVAEKELELRIKDSLLKKSQHRK